MWFVHSLIHCFLPITLNLLMDMHWGVNLANSQTSPPTYAAKLKNVSAFRCNSSTRIKTRRRTNGDLSHWKTVKIFWFCEIVHLNLIPLTSPALSYDLAMRWKYISSLALAWKELFKSTPLASIKTGCFLNKFFKIFIKFYTDFGLLIRCPMSKFHTSTNHRN